MKKKLALIHTVNWYEQSVLEPFGREFAEQNPDIEMINIMDDSLLAESLAHGAPTPAVIRRFMLYAMAAESAGADAIMCSCTTMGEATRIARKVISVPLFNIDEPMAREAVAAGEKIGIVATVPTSGPATRALLLAEAERAGRDVQTETVINEQAFRHLLAGEIEKHDALVHAEIDRLAPSVDVIALGQISLSKLRHPTRVPILQVGRSGFCGGPPPSHHCSRMNAQA
jgi:aspartate/glutamate racemase